MIALHFHLTFAISISISRDTFFHFKATLLVFRDIFKIQGIIQGEDEARKPDLIFTYIARA